MQIPTFSDPALSLLQSALHQTLVKRGEQNTRNMSVGNPAMRALVTVGASFTQPGQTLTPHEIEEEILRCAGLYFKYAFASPAEQQLLEDELKGSNCDLLWSEALAAYWELLLMGDHVQYLAYDPDQRPNPPMVLGSDTVSLALLADWGMGTPLAANLLAQAVTALSAGDPPVQQPAASMLIHMGDIYYAGTAPECQANFVDLVKSTVHNAFTPEFPVYAIPGNHEYYSGAAGFYGTVLPATAGQTNSFFCLRTGQWQVVALDTGRHDLAPLEVSRNITYLTDDQVEWLTSVMASAGNRRTILLTHHQLYSAASGVGKEGAVSYGINPRLYAQLKPYFGQIAVWLWGHEHNTVIFKPRQGVPLGRCIGSASVPMMVGDHPYAPVAGLVGVDGIDVPEMDLSVQLSNNGTDYSHGFAVLSLSPEQAVVNYYQVPLPTPGQTDPPSASWMWGEQFPASTTAASGAQGSSAGPASR